MIKTESQRQRTAIQIEGFRNALNKTAETEDTGKGNGRSSSKRGAAIRGSYESMIRQLEDELREYDQLKSGHFADTPQSIERLDQIAPFIVKLRIAKGVSQTELARRLGVSKQVISRCEEDDYSGVGVARLQQILDAIGVTARITLTA